MMKLFKRRHNKIDVKVAAGSTTEQNTLAASKPNAFITFLSGQSIDIIFRGLVSHPTDFPASLENKRIVQKFLVDEPSRKKLLALASMSKENCAALIDSEFLNTFPEESKKLKNIQNSFELCCNGPNRH